MTHAIGPSLAAATTSAEEERHLGRLAERLDIGSQRPAQIREQVARGEGSEGGS